MLPYYSIIFFLWVFNAELVISEVAFELPDLITEWNDGTNSYRLEGFKERSNDNYKDAGKNHLLRWVSLGLPRLIRSRPAPSHRCAPQIYIIIYLQL